MKSDITLSIFIVNFNVRDDLYECLLSIFTSNFSDTLEVIVVDNASQEDSLGMLRDVYPQVTVLANSVNVGFPKANNQALAIARGEYVLYLNPDTVLMPDTLTSCLEFMRCNSDVGMMGCKVMTPDGAIQYECARNFPSLDTMFWDAFYLHMLFPKSRVFGKALMSYWDHLDSRYVPCLIGAFMLGRRSLIQKLGGMDETVFMFFEDIDLCYRVHREGYRIYYLADVSIIHKSGRSQKKFRGSLVAANADAFYMFFKKHRGNIATSISHLILFIRGVFRFGISHLLFPFS